MGSLLLRKRGPNGECWPGKHCSASTDNLNEIGDTPHQKQELLAGPDPMDQSRQEGINIVNDEYKRNKVNSSQTRMKDGIK